MYVVTISFYMYGCYLDKNSKVKIKACKISMLDMLVAAVECHAAVSAGARNGSFREMYVGVYPDIVKKCHINEKYQVKSTC